MEVSSSYLLWERVKILSLEVYRSERVNEEWLLGLVGLGFKESLLES